MATLKVSNRLFSRYKSVQRAIEAADDGDVIEVEPAVYEERLEVNKPITLVGKADAVNEVVFTGGIHIDTSGTVCLQNIKVLAVSYCVRIIRGKVMIDNCVIKGAENIGVFVGKQGILDMKRSTVSDNNYGLAVSGKAAVEQCSFTGGKTESQLIANRNGIMDIYQSVISDGTGNGIVYSDESGGAVQGCDISANGQHQVLVESGSEVRLEENDISAGGKTGVVIVHSDTEILKCNITNHPAGIRVLGPCNVQVTDSELSENGSDTAPQIYISNESTAYLSGSKVTNGKGQGIVSEGTAAIEDCFIAGHPGNQISAKEGSDVSVTACTIQAGKAVGIRASGASVKVIGSQLSEHNYPHVSLFNNAQVLVKDTEVRNGEGNGLLAREQSKLILKDSLIQGHADYPQIFIRKSDLEMSHCTVKESGNSSGINLVEGSTGSIEDCNVSAHASAQISVLGESELTVKQTKLFQGKGRAVRVDGAKISLENCEIDQHEIGQIIVQDGEGEFLDCKVYDGDKHGFIVEGASTVVMERTEVFDHKNEETPVVFVGEDSEIEVKACKIYNNLSRVLLRGAKRAVIEDSIFYENNHESQIKLNGADNVQLRNNRITNGEEYGIVIEQSNPVIDSCIIENHRVQPILASEDSNPQLIGMQQEERSGEDRNKRIQPAGNADEEESAGLEELLAELDSYIGLGSVKSKIREFINMVEISRFRKEQGLQASTPKAPHFVFSGNPGTGKTTIARLIGGIFREMGLLEKGHLVEVGREDLVGRYIGDTENNTKETLEEALGGVLFIDEAYALTQNAGSSSNDFGLKVIDTLVPALENHLGEFIVIAAGYPEEMEQFLTSNPGLKDRFTEKLHFADYQPEELLEIFHKICQEEGYQLGEQAEERLYEEIIYLYRKRDETFSNARMMRNFFQTIRAAHSSRVAQVPREQWTKELMVLFTVEDMQAVLTKEEQQAFDMPINEELLEVRLNRLNELIGLDSVKQEINKQVNLIRYYKKENREPKHLIKHMLLLGNPGTGKTEVGRILAGIYEALGLLERGDLIEVDRSGLVDKYRGGTEEKTKQLIEQAQGSTLFIDEAYALTSKDRHDPGHTAVEILLKQMSDLEGKFMVIAAGYKREMQQFLDSNSGLRRRFGLTLEFEDYTPDELMEITELYLKHYRLTDEAAIALEKHYEVLYTNRDDTFGNAGLARKIANESVKNLDFRMSQLTEAEMTEQMKTTIEEEDLSLLES